MESQCRDAKRHKGTAGGSRNAERNQSKRQHTSDDEDDHAGRPHNPNKPTFIATRATREDVNAAFTRDVECNFAALDPTFAMAATRTLPLWDAWIVDSGCAQHAATMRQGLFARTSTMDLHFKALMARRLHQVLEQ